MTITKKLMSFSLALFLALGVLVSPFFANKSKISPLLKGGGHEVAGELTVPSPRRKMIELYFAAAPQTLLGCGAISINYHTNSLPI